MTESPAEFTRRTGRPYNPPQSITTVARASDRSENGVGARREAEPQPSAVRPLAPDAPCPTLFRFPGGCGLAEYFLGSLFTLAKSADAELWAAAGPVNAEVPGAIHFGTFAILQPLHFGMCEATPGIWVGANRPIDDPGHIAWVPPSAMLASIPWERIADAEDLASRLGSGVERERGEVIDSLDLYAREVEAIARAGVPDPEIRWCDRSEELRTKLLAEFGVSAVWTGTTRARAAEPVDR